MLRGWKCCTPCKQNRKHRKSLMIPAQTQPAARPQSKMQHFYSNITSGSQSPSLAWMSTQCIDWMPLCQCKHVPKARPRAKTFAIGSEHFPSPAFLLCTCFGGEFRLEWEVVWNVNS
eukprot:4092365-Amphidinium_carterae.2